jgi:flagellar protein FliL
MVDDDSLEPRLKAKLDDSELSDDLPKALQKVDLDLDDAPFLEDEKEEVPPPAEADTSPFGEEAEVPPPSKKKRLLILAGLGLGLVLVAVTAAFFLLRKPAPPPPAPEPVPVPEPAPEPTPPPPEPPKPPQERVMAMAPFLVEMTDAKGRTRFLTIRFTAVTLDQAVELEFKRNTIVVRDAVYYYLKNKSMEFLTDKNNIETLKKDVLSVINQFIGAQPLDNLLIEEYLVK